MKRENKISVSVMCSDLMNLGQDIADLKRNGVDMLHVDVMDAHFVPNLTFGLDFIHAMHEVTDMPLDVHLMAEDPMPLIEHTDLREGDYLTVHVELDKNFEEIKNYLSPKGVKFGLAVSPETPVESVKPYLPILDAVTLIPWLISILSPFSSTTVSNFTSALLNML